MEELGFEAFFWRKSPGRTNPPCLRGSKHCSYDKNGLVKEGLKYGLTGNTLECVQHGHSLRVEYDNDVTNHGSRVKGVWVIRYGNLPTPFGTVGPIHGDSYHLKVWPQLGSIFDFSFSHFQIAVFFYRTFDDQTLLLSNKITTTSSRSLILIRRNEFFNTKKFAINGSFPLCSLRGTFLWRRYLAIGFLFLL